MMFLICDSTHWKGPNGSEVQNWLFAISKMAVHSVQFWANVFLKSDIASLRYDGIFIHDVIIDQWKVYIEKKALQSLWIRVKYWCTSPILHQIHLATYRVSIEDSKIYGILRLILGPCFEIFWLCTSVTQNQIFQQLEDMLSHIFQLRSLLQLTALSPNAYLSITCITLRNN